MRGGLSQAGECKPMTAAGAAKEAAPSFFLSNTHIPLPHSAFNPSFSCTTLAQLQKHVV
jgi:hypothetical protein